jgi:hypothetical protein
MDISIQGKSSKHTTILTDEQRRKREAEILIRVTTIHRGLRKQQYLSADELRNYRTPLLGNTSIEFLPISNEMANQTDITVSQDNARDR